MEERYCNAMVVMPNAAVCFNFLHNSQRLKKSSWLVPHVVRHREDSDVISWRCNWGHLCESECFYALAKEKTGAQNARGVQVPNSPMKQT
jgi:hypothetical protein